MSEGAAWFHHGDADNVLLLSAVCVSADDADDHEHVHVHDQECDVDP